MDLVWLLVLFCTMLFSCLLTNAVTPKNIFILAGQSNMAGRGGVEKDNSGTYVWDRYVPPEAQSDPSILRLSPESQWEIAVEPVHEGIDIKRVVGVGPGIAFARQLREKAGLKAGVVGLVPCARGGTFIEQWLKNPNNPDATFYQNLIERIKASQKEGGVVRALFWLQGESDAAMSDTASRYKDNLKNLLTDIRNDTKPTFLPIIVVKIAVFDSFLGKDASNLQTVRVAEDAVQQELPDTMIIDSLNLVNTTTNEGFNKDNGHFNTKTEIALGKWLADTYLSQYGQLL